MGIFQLKLNLPARLFNEVKEQQAREVLQFLVSSCAHSGSKSWTSERFQFDHQASPIYRRILCCSTMPQREGELALQREIPSPVTSAHA